jgi:hypothetical protein
MPIWVLSALLNIQMPHYHGLKVAVLVCGAVSLDCIACVGCGGTRATPVRALNRSPNGRHFLTQQHMVVAQMCVCRRAVPVAVGVRHYLTESQALLGAAPRLSPFWRMSQLAQQLLGL